ncbi:MAG TPA: Holliday junction resolvase RuvX [Firmicutes bacterium]|nr:Holliday junction resolvase RuvX [Bacillota bacterium]
MRVMAIDFGDARIGLAVSDPLGMIAGEAWTLSERDMARAAETIAAECRERGVGELVLGLPLNMDGSEGPRAEKSREFAAMLEAAGAPRPTFWDERRTSVDAHRILHENGLKMKKHRQKVDAVAASLILEAYLGTK